MTLAKWSVEDYHLMIDSGILNNRSVELFKEGTINAIAFPNIQIANNSI